MVMMDIIGDGIEVEVGKVEELEGRASTTSVANWGAVDREGA